MFRPSRKHSNPPIPIQEAWRTGCPAKSLDRRSSLELPTPQETPSASPRQGGRTHWRLRRVEQPSGSPNCVAKGCQSGRSPAGSSCRGRRCEGYLRREHCPRVEADEEVRRSTMDAHREWIDACIAEGRTNASELHRELASNGVRLSYAAVRRYLTKRLGRAGKSRPRVSAARPKADPTRRLRGSSRSTGSVALRNARPTPRHV